MALATASPAFAGHQHGKLSSGSWEGEWSDDGGGDSGYSVSSLQGTFVLRFSGYQNGTGTNPSAPITGLAVLTFDGSGGVTGTETTNALLNDGSGSGVVCSGSLAGSSSPNYTVNPDGTGSATLQLTLDAASAANPACPVGVINNDFNFVISGDHRLAVSSSDTNGTWGGDAIGQED